MDAQVIRPKRPSELLALGRRLGRWRSLLGALDALIRRRQRCDFLLQLANGARLYVQRFVEFVDLLLTLVTPSEKEVDDLVAVARLSELCRRHSFPFQRVR